jgi:hypothetical protein
MSSSVASWSACLPNGFLEAIEIRPRADGAAAAFFLLTVSCALGAIGLADLSWRCRVSAAVATLVVAGAQSARQLRTHSPWRVRRAVLGADGHWQIFPGRGAVTNGRLSRAWGVSLGPVIGLEWSCADGRRRQAWLTKRDLPGEAWRRLRVRLRLT